jgi:uncharacterized protein YjbI with pentapeptide repeats
MLVVNRVVKKEIINEIKGIDFSNRAWMDIAGEITDIDFTGSKFLNVNFTDVVNFTGCKFFNCDFTGSTNMMSKENFLIQVGLENVNAETLWIDGTSILLP